MTMTFELTHDFLTSMIVHMLYAICDALHSICGYSHSTCVSWTSLHTIYYKRQITYEMVAI